jgi:hypothetical protein
MYDRMLADVVVNMRLYISKCVDYVYIQLMFNRFEMMNSVFSISQAIQR